MKNLKQLGLLVGLTSLILSSDAFASKKPPTTNDQEEKKSPTVAQKIGKETARVIGQGEEAIENIKGGFNVQRKKDKENKKQLKEKWKQERRAQEKK